MRRRDEEVFWVEGTRHLSQTSGNAGLYEDKATTAWLMLGGVTLRTNISGVLMLFVGKRISLSEQMLLLKSGRGAGGCRSYGLCAACCFE